MLETKSPSQVSWAVSKSSFKMKILAQVFFILTAEFTRAQQSRIRTIMNTFFIIIIIIWNVKLGAKPHLN